MNPITQFQVIVCGAIRNKQGEILLARRKREKYFGGYWEFPGGKLEHGEELIPALEREIREELAVRIGVKKLLHVKPHLYDHGAVLILFYLCELASGTPALHDHDRIEWCEAKDLKKFRLLPANEEVIAILQQGVKNGA